MPQTIAESLLEYLASASTIALPKAKDIEAATEEILAILRSPERSGGTSYSLYFGDLWQQPFYAVGLNNDWTEDLNPAQLAYTLQRFLGKYQDWLQNPRCCLGVWSGYLAGQPLVVLDISVLVYDEEVARRFGREGNQIAIFSLKEGREIPTAGTGEATEVRLRRLEQEDRRPSPPGADNE